MTSLPAAAPVSFVASSAQPSIRATAYTCDARPKLALSPIYTLAFAPSTPARGYDLSTWYRQQLQILFGETRHVGRALLANWLTIILILIHLCALPLLVLTGSIACAEQSWPIPVRNKVSLSTIKWQRHEVTEERHRFRRLARSVRRRWRTLSLPLRLVLNLYHLARIIEDHPTILRADDQPSQVAASPEHCHETKMTSASSGYDEPVDQKGVRPLSQVLATAIEGVNPPQELCLAKDRHWKGDEGTVKTKLVFEDEDHSILGSGSRRSSASDAHEDFSPPNVGLDGATPKLQPQSSEPLLSRIIEPVDAQTVTNDEVFKDEADTEQAATEVTCEHDHHVDSVECPTYQRRHKPSRLPRKLAREGNGRSIANEHFTTAIGSASETRMSKDNRSRRRVDK